MKQCAPGSTLGSTMTAAALITENATPASHSSSQRSTGWRKFKVQGYSLGSLPCDDAGCDPQDPSHAGQGLSGSTLSLNTTSAQALGLLSATSQQTANVERTLGCWTSLLLHSQCPGSHPVFLLLKERALKPDTSGLRRWPTAFGGSSSRRVSELPFTQIRPLCKTPPSPLFCQTPISLPPC